MKKSFEEKLKKAVIDGKTSMYSKERTDGEKDKFKEIMLNVYADRQIRLRRKKIEKLLNLNVKKEIKENKHERRNNIFN